MMSIASPRESFFPLNRIEPRRANTWPSRMGASAAGVAFNVATPLGNNTITVDP